MTPFNEAWLALAKEEPLEPGLAICDAHHHLWDSALGHYMLEDYLRDIAASGHKIVQSVYIEQELMYRKNSPEAMRPVGETEFVSRLAAGNESGTDVAAAIIGFADFTLGDRVAAVLEGHIAASPRFRGIRSVSMWHASPEIVRVRKPSQGLLMDSRFREGFASLRRYNLTFDAWMYHTQLAEVIDLAGAFPDIPIILGHMGGPIGAAPYAGRRAEVMRDWKKSMEKLAESPNVSVKLGGIGMPLFGFGWENRKTPPGAAEVAADMEPYFDFCISKFGVERCMFESNFPPDKTTCSYGVIWNAFKRLARGFSPNEKAALFLGNARRVYRLPSP